MIVPRHPQRFDSVAKHLDESGVAWQRRTHLDDDLLSGPLKKGATAGLSSSEGKKLTKNTAGQASSGTPRTGLDEKPLNTSNRVLLVDVVGELGAWWGVAQIAFVGGSFGNRGGQNMIEPAAYGAAVSFGPNTRNFRDIVAAILARDAAVVVQDGAALERFVRRCLEDPAYAADLGGRARDLVGEQLGATRQTVELLAGLFSDEAENKGPRKGRNAA